MPGRDGTGPQGMGAMTGRGMGNCNTSRRSGRGIGRGAGSGCRRGFGNRRGIFVANNSGKTPGNKELDNA